jgi:hypothetical protein
MSSDACATCGSPFAASMRVGELPPDVRARDAVMWSLVFPGLGHRLVGRPMDGVARGALFGMSLGMALLLSLAGSGTGATTGVLILFVGAALVVYILSAVEAARLAEGGDLLVGSRLLMWILVGMTFASVGALALSVVGASRG